VAHFPISDWSLSDTELLNDLEQWLKKKRPRDCVKRETRGRSVVRSIRARLKALGAYRLSRVMSQNEVLGFAIAHERELYKNQPELSKVLNKTASYLEWLDHTEVS